MKMKEYYVYILKCCDKSYYTGSTSDLENRLIQHQEGVFEGYTSSRRPLELVYTQRFSDVKDAISAERRIKTWSRKKKEALIASNFGLLHDLSACKNETHHSQKK